MTAPTSVAPLDVYAELAFHVLAHVPAPDAAAATSKAGKGALRIAACLYDPRYVAYAHRVLPAGAREWAERDAAVLGHLWATAEAEAIARVSVIPFLFEDLDAFRAKASRSVADVLPGPTTPLTELVWCVMGLSAGAFEAGWREVFAPATEHAVEAARPWIDRVVAAVPALARSRVGLSFVLGPRGRVVGDRIAVGAPAPWNDLPAAWPAMMALHELAVSVAAEVVVAAGGTPSWGETEGLALAAPAALAVPAEIASLHASWAASVDRRAFAALDPHRVEALIAALRG